MDDPEKTKEGRASKSTSLIPPLRLDADALLRLGFECGAADCGLVSIDDPVIAEDRPYILAAFPATRTLLVIVARMHREPIRSPARSIANLEFHQVGSEIDEIARSIVGRLEDLGVPALNPAMAFPMEMDNFPERAWVVSHKRAAEAAGLGRMGIHRSVIHPKFGSFILLGTVLIAVEVERFANPVEFSPCVECKLCVATCPVGAIKPDGYFDFSACFTHNYQQFMGGFVNWVEDIADSRSARDYRTRSSYAETVSRWQSLSYGPNYNAAYCIAVCPAGTDVIAPYLADKASHLETIVRPLQRKTEPIYVTKGSDAADYVAARFPHKRVRWVRSSARATSVRAFLAGMPLTFQPGKAGTLDANYHFAFTGSEKAEATVVIREHRITVMSGHQGRADLRITANSEVWLRFLRGEVSILWCLTSRAIRLKGPPRLMVAFGRCFPR
jgi:epoxyqueuosine reductase QueG